MSLISEPVKDFNKGRNFFLRENGVFHNGINIETLGPVKTITKGKVLAYRFSKDYVTLEDFDTNCILKKHFHYMGNNFFDNIDNLENTNDNYKTYFEKDENCTPNDEVYKLKQGLNAYDKVEAFYYLRRIISNSFVLMEYEVTLLNAEKFKFYMLYNHLSPMGRLTCSQKTALPWYSSKLLCKNAKYYYVETEEGVKLPSELILTKATKIANSDKYEISWDKYPGLEAGSGIIRENLIRPDLTPPETRRPYRNGIDNESKKSKCLADADLKQIDGIIVYTSEKLGSRNVRAILDKNTVFDYILKDLKNIKDTFYPYKIFHKGLEGYIYLNESQKYTNIEDWKVDIDKYYNVITNTDVEIQLKTCQLKITRKEMKNAKGVTFKIEEDKIELPADFEIDSDTVIGFSGFNFMKEETIGQYKYVSYDNDTKPFDIHIETFIEDENKLKFDYFENNNLKDFKMLEPFFLKVKSGTKLVSKKPECGLVPAVETYDGCIAKVEKGFGYYDDEEYLKLTLMAKAIPIPNNIYVDKTAGGMKHVGYKGHLNWYQVSTTVNAKTYDKNYTQISNSNVSLIAGYLYHVDTGRGPAGDAWNSDGGYAKQPIRHIECQYELITPNKIFYIKAKEYEKLTNKKEGFWFTEKDQKDIVWIRSKLNSSNIYSELNSGNNESEVITQDLTLTSTSEELIEYSDIGRKTEVNRWMKIKSNTGGIYWIKNTDIKTEKDSTPIEIVSYYDWQKLFNKLTLKDEKKYIVCDPKKLQSSDKSYAKFREFNDELKTQSIIDCGIDENFANDIIHHNEERYYFTHINEWSNTNKQVEDLKKLSFDLKRTETSLETYKFFPDVKGKNLIPAQDTFCYIHPRFFLENLKKITTIPEFNPYQSFYESTDEKIKKSMLFVPKEEYWIKKTETNCNNLLWNKPNNEEDYIHVKAVGGWEPTDYIKNGTVVKPKILDNPGFTSIKTEENGIAVYDSIYGAFNEDYIDVRTNPKASLPAVTYRSSGKTVKRHIGIDYYPGNNKKIVSLIHGRIISKGWITSDGLSLLVQRDSPEEKGNNYLYLACHISSFAENLKEGDRIIPGQTVGYTGSSGVKNGKLIRNGCFGAHLHVSVIKCQKKIASNTEVFKTISNIVQEYAQISSNTNIKSDYPHYKEWNTGYPAYVDPFNYDTNYWS